jgi:tetratricopeptide (TPR) repeat protein
MQSPSIFVISRDDRLYAFDRVGIPANTQLSRATLLRIAEQMDVDYVVLGSYNYDGRTFTTNSQLLDMRRLHLSPPVTESGSLLQLIDLQSASAWDLLHQLQPSLLTTKQEFVAEDTDVRLDALENYVRGVMAGSTAERVRHFKEAIRVNPTYSVAMLQLGKTYFEQRDYTSAVTWLGRVPTGEKHGLEANFFLGLAAYYSGNLERAEEAFRLVASHLPLNEVYNNLGIVEARRGKAAGIQDLQKAVQADPSNADYHFNLAVALARWGDTAGAARQLKEALGLRPADAEAKAYLETVSAGGKGTRFPAERIKRNYDETSFRELAFAIATAEELHMANSDPRKHAAMHVDRGREELREGFLEQARESFRKAISLDPTSADAHLGLANSEIALNNLPAARSELDQVLRARPSAEAYVALGQLDLQQNRIDDANEDVAEALKLEPGNAAAIQLKQQLASKIGGTAQARP